MNKKKIIAICCAALVVVWFTLECLMIKDWTSTTTFGKRIGVIEYRDSFGEFNRVMMSINEGIMWIFGYSFNGPSVYGTLGQWGHTYTKDVSE